MTKKIDPGIPVGWMKFVAQSRVHARTAIDRMWQGEWRKWELEYKDGSRFCSEQGEWEDAPRTEVVNLSLHYGIDVPDGPFHTDTGIAPFYIWRLGINRPLHSPEVMTSLRLTGHVKYGEWVETMIFERARDRAIDRAVKGEWAIYYGDGSVVTSKQMSWNEAPLDGVLVICDRNGICHYSCDYYFWENGQLVTSNDLYRAVAVHPRIKVGSRI
jgi:hypothetical protein